MSPPSPPSAQSPRSLGVCVAHPDDETYATFGSVALHRADPGFRLVVLHATDGDAGEVAPGVDVGEGGLGPHRRLEDARAWEVVGHPPDGHEWLGHRDGQLTEVPFHSLVAQVEAFLERERPDVVVTFGPHGVTGHPDHITIGRATDLAFRAVRDRGGPGLRRLLHTGIRESTFRRHQAWMAAHGYPPWQPDRLYHLRGTPDEEIGVEVRTKSVSDVVVAAMKEHRSQRHVLFGLDADDETWRTQTTRETHVIAWPPREPGQPCLRDIFEGLD